MRKSPLYDNILESKESDFLLKTLTSREVFAVFYANDLFDNRVVLKDILKLFDNMELKTLVMNTLLERIRMGHKKKLVVAWAKAGVHLRVSDIYNKQYVNDLDYINNYYPVRSLMRTEVS